MATATILLTKPFAAADASVHPCAEATELDRIRIAALALQASGSVCFKVGKRIDMSRFNRWQRLGYEYFVRSLPAESPWHIPGVVPMEKGVITSFALAASRCKTPDHQLLVLPLDWLYDDDRMDVEVTCRPRDPKDAARYELLKGIFKSPQPYDDSPLRRYLNILPAIDSRLCALEDRVHALDGEDADAIESS